MSGFGSSGGGFGQLIEQEDRLHAGPLDVFEHHQAATSLGQSIEEVGQGADQPLLGFSGREFGRLGHLGDPWEVGELGEDLPQNPRVVSEQIAALDMCHATCVRRHHPRRPKHT